MIPVCSLFGLTVYRPVSLSLCVTQRLRRTVVKILLTCLLIGGGFAATVIPTQLVNAATVPVPGTCTVADTSGCNDVCQIVGNCPAALQNQTNTKGSFARDVIVGYVNTIANSLIALAAVISVFFIISAGWTILSGGGKGDGLKEGQQKLTNGVIGLAICVLSFFIVQLTVGVLNTFL